MHPGGQRLGVVGAEHPAAAAQCLTNQDFGFGQPALAHPQLAQIVDRIERIAMLVAEVKSAKGTKETRTVLKLDKRLAPYDCAVLPLSKSEKLIAKAEEIYRMLLEKTTMNVEFDITGSIGKRYRRQDEIGTPTCITVDFGTIGEDENQCKKDHVTVRDRDSLKQEEIEIGALVEVLRSS